jgi:hypothetical protein
VVSPAPEPKVPDVSPEELARLKKEIAAAKRELASVEEALDIQSFGFYSPKYGFEEVAQYVSRLATIRAEQKRLITDDLAAPCDTTWTVGGSKAEGKKMVRQQAKLMLRAFNGECDAAIAKVKYDNVTTLEERLRKAFEQINKLGEVQRVFVSARYFDLKMAELHLVHEHREKVQEEKEEQKRIREQMKEEQRAQAEIDRAKAEAEKEEAQSAAALAKAQAELAVIEAAGKHNDKLEALVSRLESELKEALDRKAKAIARAQLTKSGHVYVLSNIGSFGEGGLQDRHDEAPRAARACRRARRCLRAVPVRRARHHLRGGRARPRESTPPSLRRTTGQLGEREEGVLSRDPRRDSSRGREGPRPRDLPARPACGGVSKNARRRDGSPGRTALAACSGGRRRGGDGIAGGAPGPRPATPPVRHCQSSAVAAGRTRKRARTIMLSGPEGAVPRMASTS